MKNLTKSIIYEMLKSKLMLVIYFILAGVMILLGLINVPEYLCTSGVYVTDPSMMYTFPLFVIAAVVGIVICPDYKDKVANYEVLSGHSRISVYLSRTLCAIVAASLLAFSLTFLPMIAGNIMCGWGDKISFTDALLRQLLFIFPLIRLAAFTACLAFIIKNEYVLIGIGAGYVFGSLIISSVFEDVSSSVLISFYNLNYLMSYDKWTIYNITQEMGIVKYTSAVGSIDGKMIIGTIAVSSAMTLIYLIIGYALFRRSEMN